MTTIQANVWTVSINNDPITRAGYPGGEFFIYGGVI